MNKCKDCMLECEIKDDGTDTRQKNKKSHPWDSQHKNSPIFRTYNNIIYIIINIYIYIYIIYNIRYI
jgi:hypothetical protein